MIPQIASQPEHTRVAQVAFQSDPTRTTTLRRLFVNQMDARFNALKRISTDSIFDNDCFDLKPSPWSAKVKAKFSPIPPPKTWKNQMTPLPPKSFQFMTVSEKIENFTEWLEVKEGAAVYQRVVLPENYSGDNPLWTNTYIATAYKHGMLWARHALRADKDVLSALGLTKDEISTKDTSINADFGSIVNINRVQTIYTRSYSDLKGITSTMDAQISRILADSLIRGDHPKDIARLIASRISSIGKHRADLLARTEVIRAHHLGAIQTYRQFGVVGVRVVVEWNTAGDDRVCELCAPLEGKTFTLDEIEFKIPLHPQCRCGVIPVIE